MLLLMDEHEVVTMDSYPKPVHNAYVLLLADSFIFKIDSEAISSFWLSSQVHAPLQDYLDSTSSE